MRGMSGRKEVWLERISKGQPWAARPTGKQVMSDHPDSCEDFSSDAEKREGSRHVPGEKWCDLTHALEAPQSCYGQKSEPELPSGY